MKYFEQNEMEIQLWDAAKAVVCEGIYGPEWVYKKREVLNW